MNKLYRYLALPAIALIVTILASCGGGGNSLPPNTPVISAHTITGVAATGAPVIGVVSIKDSSSPAKELLSYTASDGSFAFNTINLTAPFLLKASSAGGNLYSMAATDTGISNLTPLTTVAASVATGGADLNTLYLNANPASMVAAVANMTDSVTVVQSVLYPLLNQYGVTDNILTAPFNANHTGIDALMDSINVTVLANTVTITNKVNSSVIYSGSSSHAVTPAGTQMPMLTGTLTAANIPAPPVMPGYALYTANCSGCHGNITNSALFGISTPATISAAIARDLGGMSFLARLSAGDIQAINMAINNPAGAPAIPAPPAPASGVPAAGATLYTTHCSGCHGPLATSAKLGATFVRIQNAISGNVGGMSSLIALTGADLQAIEAALNPAPTIPASGVPPVTPVIDGAALYTLNCSGCHGPLATSTKIGITIARFQNAVANNTGGMNYLSTLTVSQVQAIVTALTPATPTPTTPPVTPPATPGAALYATACASCHGALASSAKAGATVVRITTAIGPGVGSVPAMAYLSTLTPADISALAATLATVAPPATPVVPACGSCHALPPATGMHLFHLTNRKAVALAITCATCHGTGYSTAVTTDKLPATHNNGVKNMAAGIPPGWTPNPAPATGGSCSNACHGRKVW